MDKIAEELKKDDAEDLQEELTKYGKIGELYASLDVKGDNLLGFVLRMEYEEGCIISCDTWKQKCGGVPKNSFVLMKLKNDVYSSQHMDGIKPTVILARVIGADDVPLSNEVRQTIFTIHKVQAVLDPFTNSELQWGALKIAILGSYFDGDDGKIEFGNDIDFFMSPHFYEVYVPEADDLEMLINSFVDADNSVEIGHLKYTETQTRETEITIPIRVAPKDFIANRTALFGKTRMGKSNTIKVIADMMIKSGANIGQVIFDFNGEYSNVNPQDEGSSLYKQNSEKCTRYSIIRRTVLDGEEPPKALKVNFFAQIALGHSIITNLWDYEVGKHAAYMDPFLSWEPCDINEIQQNYPDFGDKVRYQRALSMYFAVLKMSGFSVPNNVRTVYLNMNQRVKQHLATLNIDGVALVQGATTPEVEEIQSLDAAILLYKAIYNSPEYASRNDARSVFSPTGGKAYFDPIHDTFLKIIGDQNAAASKILMRFIKFHDVRGINITSEIRQDVDDGKTVIIDLSNTDEKIAGFFSEIICKDIFRGQTQKFIENRLGDHSVLFYFEEAHNLFQKDDSDLKNIYNRLAKEGAKNRIGMVYATQSMSTLSRDLLKNTENYFIAHLNDSQEITELVKRYEFRDIGPDVQRCKTRGYVRMITLSHRYALPVQIKKMGTRE